VVVNCILKFMLRICSSCSKFICVSIHELVLLQGSAKRLVKAALQEAARKREMRYSDLQKIDKKVRRHFHDDITVIVLFLNHDLISKSKSAVQTPPVSIRSAN
jgi:predicted nucleic acid-binding OB-fold protein